MFEGLRYGADLITSGLESVGEDARDIVKSFLGLGDIDITKDDESNLTAVKNAQTIYSRSQDRYREFGELMKTEAGHIETLGNEFEKLDQDISDMVKKYFG